MEEPSKQPQISTDPPFCLTEITVTLSIILAFHCRRTKTLRLTFFQSILPIDSIGSIFPIDSQDLSPIDSLALYFINEFRMWFKTAMHSLSPALRSLLFTVDTLTGLSRLILHCAATFGVFISGAGCSFKRKFLSQFALEYYAILIFHDYFYRLYED